MALALHMAVIVLSIQLHSYSRNVGPSLQTHVYSCKSGHSRLATGRAGHSSFRIPVGTKHFLFSKTVQTGCGAHQTSYSGGGGGFGVL